MTYGQTDTPSYREARTDLTRPIGKLLFKTMLVSVGQSVIKWELVKYEVSIQGKLKLVIFPLFLDASSHLYKRVCPSVRRSVRRSVGPSVTSYFQN